MGTHAPVRGGYGPEVLIHVTENEENREFAVEVRENDALGVGGTGSLTSFKKILV